MKTLKQICVCALLTALTGLVVCAIVLVRTATGTMAVIPGQIDVTRAALVGEIAAGRQDLIHQVADSRHDLLVRTERQAAALREGVLTEAGQIRQDADRRVGDTLARPDPAPATAPTPQAQSGVSGRTPTVASAIPSRAPTPRLPPRRTCARISNRS